MTAPTGTHHDHNRAEDLLESYVLGTLPAGDASWMEAHVRECPQCREEIAPLMSAVQALPFSAPEPNVAASNDLWDRIERAVSTPRLREDEPDFIPLSNAKPEPAPWEARRQFRWTAREWLAVAAVAVVSLVGGTVLGQALPWFPADSTTDEQVIAVQFTDPDITANGELRYLPDEQVFVLEVTGLPELPEGQVYQAWLINGSEPVPVGVMGNNTEELAAIGSREAYQTFAITVEQGPLGNPAPTSDPIMVASLQDPGPT